MKLFIQFKYFGRKEFIYLKVCQNLEGGNNWHLFPFLITITELDYYYLTYLGIEVEYIDVKDDDAV